MSGGHNDSVFQESFDESEKKELLSQDDEAWNGVTALLIFIVTGGVLLGFIGVLLATFLT
jgi:hypothetical protein